MDTLFIKQEGEKWRSSTANFLEAPYKKDASVSELLEMDPALCRDWVEQLGLFALTQEITVYCYVSNKSIIHSPYVGDFSFSRNWTLEKLWKFIDRSFEKYLQGLPSWKALQYIANYKAENPLILENGYPRFEQKGNNLIVYAMWDKYTTSATQKALARIKYHYSILKDSPTEENLCRFEKTNFGILNKSISNNNLREVLW